MIAYVPHVFKNTLLVQCCKHFAGVSKYLRHSEAVSDKHYDFSAIEQSARNRNIIVNLIGGMRRNQESANAMCRRMKKGAHARQQKITDSFRK